jgi:DNA transformation protein
MNFHTLVVDQLKDLGEVEDRPLLGGWGLWLDGSMFGIVQGERLYLLTADPEARLEYQRQGSMPYQASGPYREYYRVPATVLESRQRLVAAARRAAGSGK